MHNIFSNTSFCSVFSESILTMTGMFVKSGDYYSRPMHNRSAFNVIKHQKYTRYHAQFIYCDIYSL